MAKLKVVARVTRRAKEQALKLGLTVCAAGRNSASCLPAWDGVTERQLLSLSLSGCSGERSIQCIDFMLQ
jgi:hypothetical protein